MDFDSWTESHVDTRRIGRLAIGWVVGALTVAGGMAFVVLTSTSVSAFEEEEEGPIEVQLAKEAEPPPPPPPPPPEAVKAAPRPRMTAPTTVSDEKLEEKEPPPNLGAEEKMEEAPKEAAPAVVNTAPTAAPAVVKPKAIVKKPIRLTEDMPKPVQLVKNTPDYPPDAKAAGLEGVVIVRYVIGEDGSVRDVKALKGPPELQGSCIEAVKTWRFQPIIVDGSAVAVVRIARFPFRIR